MSNPSSRGTASRRWRIALGVLTAVVLTASLPSMQVDYVLTQAVYQFSMLLKRQAIDDVLAAGELKAEREAHLRLVADIRRFGVEEIGLAAADSYTSVAVGFERKMYNVLACRPDRFKTYRRWFPIVGGIPYIGYFRMADTQREVRRLKQLGYDVSARPVGAYSTLGYFDDPILPGMLDWPEHRLAEVLLHESAHATLFLSGQMKFNESFARYVGDRGAEAYMEYRRAEAPEAYGKAVDNWHDRDLLKGFLAELYQDLDALYHEDIPRPQKLARKREILASAQETCQGMPFREPKYNRYFQRREVNNATLSTYRTYNSGDDLFGPVYEACDDDLRCFVQALEALDDAGQDGFEWLEEARWQNH